jgi:hypothetical protein
VAKYARVYEEITAAGTVRDFHPVPYYPLTWKDEQNHNSNKCTQNNQRLIKVEDFFL